MDFRPMLSPNEDPLKYPNFFKDLSYPLSCSPKYDGIRCVIKDRRPMSRNFLILPSLQVQLEFGLPILENVDGELIEGSPTDFGVYNRTQSHVMSMDKPGDLHYYLFDYTHPDWLKKPFFERKEWFKGAFLNAENVHVIEHEDVYSYDELIAYENKQLALGFEGIMMNCPVSTYKQGRATWKQHIIHKLKRFEDAEGLIIGFIEGETNTNALESNAFGLAKRSTKKEGMVPSNTVGKIIVDFEGIELNVAPGALDHTQRKHMWLHQEDYIGKQWIKFRFMRHGMKDVPRFCRCVGLRDRIDL